MAETEGGKILPALGINLPEIIKIASVAAVIYAQWTVMGKEIDDLQAISTARSVVITQLQKDLYALQIEQARVDIRFENLREIVIEMRRQSGLRTPLPSGP
jgi:hypothetical protein